MKEDVVIALEKSSDFSDQDCLAYQAMRNEEYPTILEPATLEHSEKWLRNPTRPSKYVTIRDKSDNPPSLVGVLLFADHYDYPGCTWFSMVIKRDFQRRGLGRKLLEIVKSYSDELRAFCVEHNNYVKADGSVYPSPLDFYKKHGFFVGKNILKTESGLECVEIVWKKKEVL